MNILCGILIVISIGLPLACIIIKKLNYLYAMIISITSCAIFLVLNYYPIAALVAENNIIALEDINITYLPTSLLGLCLLANALVLILKTTKAKRERIRNS